ncbi:AraC family transcriptional regulator [Cupriavidus sp. BIC8F]|uniref:AraC family transcriptional regulator n=1 Tax=Cupriavidus sp. BIC8F TaxID=3079014 RepID=UPI0039674C5F
MRLAHPPHADTALAAAGWQARMTELMLELAPNEGYTQTVIDGVRLIRADRALPRQPVLYEPSIVVVCQGTKRGYLDEAVYLYNACHYLVLAAPLPFEAETLASAQHPLLAISIRIDLNTAAELALSIGDLARPASRAAGICSSPLDDRLADAVLRLMKCLGYRNEARVLGAGILREIYFRVLTGENGDSIRAALSHHGHFARINRALSRIHGEYDQDLSVSALADEASMSLAAFHAAFKAVTHTSPIQYLKKTRLHKARLLMVQDGLNASVAAARVGYESASQFSREFKRLFGRSPSLEAAQMSQLLSVVPVDERGARSSSSHYVIVD